MKRFSAILFLSLTLLTQTELHQVFKLPVLLQHLAEHRAHNKNMSVADFVILHYFSGNPKDKDYDRDMQLPFKTTECAAMVNVAIIPTPSYSIKLPAYFIDINYPSLANSRERFSHTADIWQPPRLS
ncbi:hypothetical protein [Ferruginibacter profundus]